MLNLPLIFDVPSSFECLTPFTNDTSNETKSVSYQWIVCTRDIFCSSSQGYYRVADSQHALLHKYRDMRYTKTITCESVINRALNQGSSFFLALLVAIIATQYIQKQKILMQISSLSSIFGFAILAYDLDN